MRVPTPLQSYTAGRAEVDASGATLEGVARDLERRFPGMMFRMIDEQDHIRPHIKIFVNGVQIFDLLSAISPGDEIVILQAFSGG